MARVTRLWHVAALAIVLVVTGVAVAGPLAITLINLTSPVVAGSDARLEVVTSPGSQCDTTVRYKSGPSRARGLISQTSDKTGAVIWRWRVGSSTTPGRWPVVVICQRGVDRGELTVHLETR